MGRLPHVTLTPRSSWSLARIAGPSQRFPPPASGAQASRGSRCLRRWLSGLAQVSCPCPLLPLGFPPHLGLCLNSPSLKSKSSDCVFLSLSLSVSLSLYLACLLGALGVADNRYLYLSLSLWLLCFAQGQELQTALAAHAIQHFVRMGSAVLGTAHMSGCP